MIDKGKDNGTTVQLNCYARALKQGKSVWFADTLIQPVEGKKGVYQHVIGGNIICHKRGYKNALMSAVDAYIY